MSDFSQGWKSARIFKLIGIVNHEYFLKIIWEFFFPDKTEFCLKVLTKTIFNSFFDRNININSEKLKIFNTFHNSQQMFLFWKKLKYKFEISLKLSTPIRKTCHNMKTARFH